MQQEDPRVQAIANKIRQLRIDAGYTSHENFAWDHELSRVQYGTIETGANITMKTLLKIIDIHGLTLSEFFHDL